MSAKKERARYSLNIIATHRCNLNCSYCLRDADIQKSEIPFTRLAEIILALNERGCRNCTVTGGEAFMYGNVEQLIELLEKLGWEVFWETNGVLVRDKKIQKLIEKMDRGKTSFLVSLDSSRKDIHDASRGKGAHDAAMTAIGILKKAGHRVSVNSVIHKANIPTARSIHQFIEVLTKNGVNGCYFSPVVAAGRNKQSPMALSVRWVENINMILKRARMYYGGRIAVNGIGQDNSPFCARLNRKTVVVSHKGFHPCLYLENVLIAPLTDMEEAFARMRSLKYLKQAADHWHGLEKSRCFVCATFLPEFIKNIPFRINES